MAAITLSHSQALRVIGQNLVSISCDSFDLITAGDDYVVTRHDFDPPRSAPSSKTFLNQWLTKTFRRANVERTASTRLHFSPSEILISNLQRQAERRQGNPTDVRDLSFVLRVLGDYLDKKLAREFSISWSPHLITVQYNGKEELFTRDNVYDFGISMYLKRSNRRSS
jgi:hypothetical protein